MNWMNRGAVALLLVAWLGVLGGCDMFGKGTQKAEFKLPEKARILVMVDPRPASNTPIDVPAALGETINRYLYKHNVGENFVAQARLTELRKNPQFARMGIADIAKATDADVVVFLDLVRFSADTQSEGQLTEGFAQGLVKVVDGRGQRLWPAETEVLGQEVQAVVAPNFASDMSVVQVRQALIDGMAIHTGRLFHDYDKEDKEVAK